MDEYEITVNPKAISERLLIAITAGTIASAPRSGSSIENMVLILMLYFTLTGGLLALKVLYGIIEEREESAEEEDPRREYDWTPHKAS